MELSNDPQSQWQASSAAKEATRPLTPANVSAKSPRLRSWLEGALDRRQFFRLVEGSLALAGLESCRLQPDKTWHPYVKGPEYGAVGQNQTYSTSLVLNGYAHGVLVKSFEGKPHKVDGHPDHPATLGASHARMQASVLSLYDPDRAKVPTKQGSAASWQDFATFWEPRRKALQDSQGAGLHVVTGAITSPTVFSALKEWQDALPLARFYEHEVWTQQSVEQGAALLYGTRLAPVYQFSKATRIAAFDSDFLQDLPASLRYAREFSEARDPESRGASLCRFYCAEASPTPTGSMADHRLRIAPDRIFDLLLSLADALGIPSMPAIDTQRLSPEQKHFATVLAQDLLSQKSSSLVLAGPTQPAAVHALTFAINDFLGSSTALLEWVTPPLRKLPQAGNLTDLSAALDRGDVHALVVFGQNPVYSSPGRMELGKKFSAVENAVYLNPYADETAQNMTWHLPESHFLESWGDATAFDGTVSFQQPLITKFYDTKHRLEVLALLTGAPAASDYEQLREYWKAQFAGDFETEWKKVISYGFRLQPKSSPLEQPKGQAKFWADLQTAWDEFPKHTPPLLLSLRMDPTQGDGEEANNPWLQELPKPIGKLTWSNAATVSPQTAKKWNLRMSDKVSWESGGRRLELPVLIQPGQVDDVITVALGYGRSAGGKVAKGVGGNAYEMREHPTTWWMSEGTFTRVGEGEPLAITQLHHEMEDRRPVKVMDLSDFLALRPPTAAPVATDSSPALSEELGWGMSIDLNRCTGCSVCVIACQAENNIPVVGKEEVLRGREMHWLRVDGYYQGSEDDPEIFHQPVPCMHCEAAPCEYVCPVGATVHDTAGLNEMIYNRCIGTRYCSNNCPYKVRRFNFFDYSDQVAATDQLQRNPDVSVRPRGVMEKCTYCIQKITASKLAAELEGRPIRDGDVLPACAQACPTQAIVFGNVKDPLSKVSQRKKLPRDYVLLERLATKPRTSYLGRVRNRNPDFKGGPA